MHRTTIMLPEDLKLSATRAAHDAGISLGELIRQALEERLRREDRGWEDDPFFAETWVHKGPAPADLAANHDRYLYDEEV